jgi:hypothetical protein
MLQAQQSVQHLDDARFVIAVITLAIMAYWRLALRLLLVLVALAAVVGAVTLVQIASIEARAAR